MTSQGKKLAGKDIQDGYAFTREVFDLYKAGERLSLLEEAKVEELAAMLGRSALHAHLYPQPQCALGRFLSNHHLPSAMMDLSDGLSIDLRRLCDASGVGACLNADHIPTPPIPDGEEALRLALDGGEDYQLLFTVPAAKASKLPRRFGRIPLRCIGEIRSGTGVEMIRDGRVQPVEVRGYDHFSRIPHRKH